MTHGRIGRRENIALFTAALLAAIGGLIYELILGTAASYLLGDSVLSFSLATGITLFGMGTAHCWSTASVQRRQSSSVSARCSWASSVATPSSCCTWPLGTPPALGRLRRHQPDHRHPHRLGDPAAGADLRGLRVPLDQ